MKNDIKVRREYDWDDEQMLERAHHFIDTLSADIIEFKKEFSFIDETFIVNFSNDLETADKITSDFEVAQSISKINDEIDHLMEEAKKEVQKMFTIIRVIFGKGSYLKTMGKPDYEKARSSYKLMVTLLDKVNKMISEKYVETELLSSGLSKEELKTISSIKLNLQEKIQIKENAQLIRQAKTIERINSYNTVWHYLEKISSASKVVFKDVSLKVKSYLLYPSIEKMPLRICNLVIDKAIKTIKWEKSNSSIEYELSYKPLNGLTDWIVCFSGIETSFKHNPGKGEWLYRCRGKNNYGIGYWSEKVSVEYDI